MIISEMNVSYPCIKYKIQVSHFTARKSTAIEWIILEAIRKAKELEHYASVPVATLFSEIFTISDADLLIRPCLFSLQDMGAIIADGMNDETELSNVSMRNLRLTPTGEKMQKDGLLPGTTSEDTFIMYYDLANNSLLEAVGNNYKSEFTGIKTHDLENIDSVDFPYAMIQRLLEEKKKSKKKGKLSWLMPTTTINDIKSACSELLWKNVVRKVNLGEGFHWHLEGNDDDRLDTLSLMSADLESPEEFDNIPNTNIKNPDKEIRKMVLISEVKDMVSDYLKNDDLFFVREKYYCEMPVNKTKKIRIGIIEEAEKFEVNKLIKQIIIKVPESLMSEEIVYKSESSSVNIGKFALSTKDNMREAVFAYIPFNQQNKIAELCMMVVDRYFEKDNSILFLLVEIGLKDLYLEYVNKLIKSKQSIREKSETIEELNNLSLQYYNQKNISAVSIEKMLVDEKYINDNCNDIEGIKKVLNEYGAISSFKQNDTLYQKVIQLALKEVKEPNSIDEVWELWNQLNKAKKTYVSWISKNNLHRRLYTNSVVKQILNYFSEDDLLGIEEYTVVEQTILNMKKILVMIQEKIPELDIWGSYSNEKILETVMLHKDELSTLYDGVRRWKDEIDKFEARICEIESVVERNSYLEKAIILINRIADALKVFFDDATLKYNTVYIVDTCTLMNEPELISWFEDGKALLIIPQVVLDELDGLKGSSNDEKAYNAREVIRAISNYKAFEWLDISEESHPELLSKDFDPERIDSKILSIAIKYSVKRPVLLTDDINLRNIADSHKINAMDLEAFKNKKSHEYLDNSKPNKKKKKKKK